VAAGLPRTQLQAALKRAGRKRSIVPEADRLRGVFRAGWAHQPLLVEEALGKQMLTLLLQLEIVSIAEAVEEAFAQHADAKSSITRCWVKNDRLNHAGYLWAFASLWASAGANAHYRRRREHGDWRAGAQRNLFTA
jgi:hypothetical protein